eukprot:1199055-Rhodomonas_salina.2
MPSPFASAARLRGHTPAQYRTSPSDRVGPYTSSVPDTPSRHITIRYLCIGHRRATAREDSTLRYLSTGNRVASAYADSTVRELSTGHHVAKAGSTIRDHSTCIAQHPLARVHVRRYKCTHKWQHAY